MARVYEVYVGVPWSRLELSFSYESQAEIQVDAGKSSRFSSAWGADFPVDQPVTG